MNKRVQRIVLLAAFASFVLISIISRAYAAGPACATSIAACGCTITQAQIYLVANDLSASQTSQPVCIEIAAPRAILNLNGHNVFGNNDGTGIGILIDRGATSVIVEGGLEADNTPEQDPANDGDPANSSAGNQAVVSRWNIGIEDDADNAIIELSTRSAASRCSRQVIPPATRPQA